MTPHPYPQPYAWNNPEHCGMNRLYDWLIHASSVFEGLQLRVRVDSTNSKVKVHISSVVTKIYTFSLAIQLEDL